jgi:hypothetical protein
VTGLNASDPDRSVPRENQVVGGTCRPDIEKEMPVALALIEPSLLPYRPSVKY